MHKLFYTLIGITLIMACTSSPSGKKIQVNASTINLSNTESMNTDSFEINLSENDWKAKLTPEQFAVLREKGPERPFTGKFEDHYEPGIYTCGGCGTDLFPSDTKFDAGCGWPSFYEAVDKTKILEKTDYGHGMVRTEIMCAKCGGHLGHVFNDGPQDKTGLRYCVNSLSLEFKKTDSAVKSK
jgi:peptide-methionine (R)-S-oxide reductase